MMEYIGKVKDLLENFVEYIIAQISREENSKADALPRLASATDTSLTRLIPMKFLPSSSINEKESGEVSSLPQVGVRWIPSSII